MSEGESGSFSFTLTADQVLLIVIVKYAGQPVGQTRMEQKSSCCCIGYIHNLHQCRVFLRCLITQKRRFLIGMLLTRANTISRSGLTSAVIPVLHQTCHPLCEEMSRITGTPGTGSRLLHRKGDRKGYTNPYACATHTACC